jgi:uncharacterized protein (DUF2249 family)
MADTTYTVDMITLPHDIKHQKLFGTIGSMQSGETLLIINDHDPRPLYFRLNGQQPGAFGWEYEQEGPDVWKVIVTRN